MFRLRQVLIAIDQLINAVCGGWADETISSRAHRRKDSSRKWAVFRYVIDILLFFDKNHCEESYLFEQQRQHLPPSLRLEEGLTNGSKQT